VSKEEEIITQEEEETEDSDTVCETCGETIADAELADHVRSHKKNGKAKATSAVKATVDPARPNRVVLDRWPTEEEKKAARGE
jgi:NDP-sugar pyrophosphorylase family protein